VAATDPAVSVLVVSYATRDLTLACLDALPAALGGLDAEVIVVDNASPDGSADALAARGDVELVALDENIGFARAVNLAARRARGRYLLLLNPDAVAAPGAVAELVAAAEAAPGAGFWGGRVVDPDGRPDPGAARGLPTPWSLLCFATGLSTVAKGSRVLDPESLGPWDREGDREVGYLTGCFLLADADAWRRLGGFDERYFMYSEDADLAARARRLGYRPRYCAAGTVVHRSGASASPGRKLVLLLTGRVTWLRAHWPAPLAAYGVAMLTAGTWLRARLAGVAGAKVPAAWQEAWDRRREWRAGFGAPGSS
jgi:GT2 family glycosyltransferase